MLILKNKKNESILIGDDIRINIIECSSGIVRVAVDAPKEVSIIREELQETADMNHDALVTDPSALQSAAAALLPYLRESC